MKQTDRRSFLKIAASSVGIGVLHSAYPAALSTGEAGAMFSALGRAHGEKPSPLLFVQLSDAHVGFNGPPDPLGTKAFERAVEIINAFPQKPDLVLFPGDLTHDTEDGDIYVRRRKQFQEISKRINVLLSSACLASTTPDSTTADLAVSALHPALAAEGKSGRTAGVWRFGMLRT